MGETKGAFAERTYDPLKKYFTVAWKNMDTSTFTNCHSSSQPRIPEKNCSEDLIPKIFKLFDILSFLYSKPLREGRKPKFKTGDRVRISKFDSPFRKGCKPQFTQKAFEIVAICSRKSPIYTKKFEEGEIVLGKFNNEFITVISQ